MRESVFFNGKFLSWDEAKMSVLAPGLLCGWGVFETMRAYNNKIVYLGKHLKRLEKSCSIIGIKCPYSLVQLKGIIRKILKINGLLDAYVRLTLWKAVEGTAISIVARKYKPYPKQKYKTGIKVTVSRFRQNENYFFAQIKTTNRLLYELSYLEAKKKGFSGSIILNNRGYIAEGSRSNIFFVKDNTVFTPTLSCGCLAGITRKVIFDLAKKYNIRVYEGNFTLTDLSLADEAFFTNSLTGIMPVASVDNKVIGKGRCGKLTKFFIEKYRFLFR